MAHACRESLTRHGAVVVIGTDCPSLQADDIHHALHALQAGADAVLGPAADGGYYLLGLRRVHEALFRDIAWGSNGVLEATRTNLQRLGWCWRELVERWDVDRPQDVSRLLAEGYCAAGELDSAEFPFNWDPAQLSMGVSGALPHSDHEPG